MLTSSLARCATVLPRRLAPPSARILSGQRFRGRIAVKAGPELAELTASIDLVSTAREISEFLLEHPVASFVTAVGAFFVIPKLVELFVRYLAGPVAIALLAFYVLEFPEDAATYVSTVLGWINAYPEVTSIVVIGLALLGLVPALLTGAAATALVYTLLSVSFGTNLPEVQQMQGKFGETVQKVQVFSKVTSMRVEQLLLK